MYFSVQIFNILFFIVYLTNGIITETILKVIYIIGGIFMLYLGLSVLRSRMPFVRYTMKKRIESAVIAPNPTPMP